MFYLSGFANNSRNSGKTTIISLLERFYDVSSGQILFNDEDISAFSFASHRRAISLVSQEPNLLQGM